LCNFTDKTLEGELPDEELSRFLVTTNFPEGDSSGAETMGLLDTTSCVLQGKSARNTGKDGMLPTAVLRADDLAASCLRGALPEDKEQ
jgi:hypothetical protein